MPTRPYSADAKPSNHNLHELLCAQDSQPMFEESSNFYIFSRSSFIDAGNIRVSLKPQMFEINKLEAIDINDREDFVLAEVRDTKRIK